MSNCPSTGVYLALHGAMAVRDVPRPEAEIARRFRELVGPDVPHRRDLRPPRQRGTPSPRTRRLRLRHQALPPLRLLHPGERGGPRPAAHRAERIPAHHGHGQARDHHRHRAAVDRPVPRNDIMERARRWEARESDAYVSVFFGYPWSDVPDVGATIQVMTNGDQALADRIADDMDDFMWRVREDFALGSYPGPAEAAQTVAAAISRGETPVAVGDYSDRPGDATHILSAFEAAGIGNVLYGTITSPATLEALAAPAPSPATPSTTKSAASPPPAAHPGPSPARSSTSARASATTTSPRSPSATATS